MVSSAETRWPAHDRRGGTTIGTSGITTVGVQTYGDDVHDRRLNHPDGCCAHIQRNCQCDAAVNARDCHR